MPANQNVQVETTTGAGTIDHNGANPSLEGASARYLNSITVKLSAAPTTAENLTADINAIAGSDYDTRILSTDPSVGSVTSVLFIPDQPLLLAPGDQIDVDYANTDTGTIGVRVTLTPALVGA